MHRPTPRLVFSTLGLASLAPGALAQSVADQVGYTALLDRVGAANAPTGAGVVAGQVEADSGGWGPDTTHPEFTGKTFVFNGTNPGVSGHATAVGQYWFGTNVGSTSIAPGVTSIECWEATLWLYANFLNGASSTPPDTVNVKLMNNSWIGNLSLGVANKILRKLDYAINTQGLIVCSGVNNGGGRLDATLVSHSFNGIAVGVSSGGHHAGPTLAGIDAPGRMKPELVAPAGATSFSTPIVSGAATLMVETARTDPALLSNPNAERPDVLRAVLMAGAEHRAGWTNNAASSGPTRGSTSQPLDSLFGADEVDVDHSHWILTGAEQPSWSSSALAQDSAHAGWSLANLGSGESRWWRFQVDHTQPTVSVLAAWNRDIALDFTSYTLPNIELQLWFDDPINGLTSLVGDGGVAHFASGNVQSISAVDNVEHLYLSNLQPGEYLLELSRPVDTLPTWLAAVAWELCCAAPIAYGTGKATSTGSLPTLSSASFPNVGATQFELRVKDGVPNKFGLAFWGTASAALPFMGGTLYVQPPITRLPVVTLDASGAVTIPIVMDASMIGAQRFFQFWFRDPTHPDGFGVGLSNGVEVRFCY